MTFEFAPLQGITDALFRRYFHQHFRGVDRYYTPFVTWQKDGPRKKDARDIAPEHNLNIPVVPQILSGSAEEFLSLQKWITNLGYHELNWNLGCPYPMVAKRKKGSGLLPFPDDVDHILEQAYKQSPIHISLKIRVGYENTNEIYPLIPVFNRYPIQKIIIHPRTGKQIYKGHIHMDVFKKCATTLKMPVIYNGDITTPDDIHHIKQQFPQIEGMMIGRGLIQNPMLLEQFLFPETQENFRHRISLFHRDLYQAYSNMLEGPGHLLQKMKQLWTYLSASFPEKRKELKALHKAKTIKAFEEAVQNVIG